MPPRRLQDVFKICLPDVFKTCLQDMSSIRLEEVFSVTIFRLPRRLEDVFKKSWWPTNVCWGGVRSWFIGLLYCILWPWSQESDKYISKSFVFCFPAKYLILVRAFSEKKSNKPITKSWNFVRTLLGSFLLKILRETSLEITKSLMSSLSWEYCFSLQTPTNGCVLAKAKMDTYFQKETLIILNFT